MISSKEILRLVESFLMGDISKFSQEFYIYINPDSSDIIEMVKDAREEQRQLSGLRIVADAKTQKVYASDAYRVDHLDIRRSVGLLISGAPWILDLLATVKSGNIVFQSVFIPDGHVKQEIHKYNWDFVKKYIKNFSLEIL